jgi:hypothetical protein
MPDLNDVVRHVILRIVVDQEGLAESLAAARAKLKGLEESEKATNKDRAKDFDKVTKAVDEQSKALEANKNAHEGAERARTKSSKDSADATREATKAVTEDTKATQAATVAEAKAEAIRKETRQKELDAIQKRREKRQAADLDAQKSATILDALQKRLAQDQIDRDNKVNQNSSDWTKRLQREYDQAAEKHKANLEKLAAETKKLQAQERNTRLGGQIDRTNAVGESAAKVARQDANAIASQERQKTESDARVNEKAKKGDLERAAAQKKLDDNNATNAAKNAANLKNLNSRLATEQTRRQASESGNLALDAQKIQDSARQSSSRTTATQARTSSAVSTAQDARDRVTSNASARRQRSLDLQAIADGRLNESQQRLANLADRGQEIADRRARAAEREARMAAQRTRRGAGFVGGLREVIGSVQSGLRASSEANPDTRTTRTRNALEGVDKAIRGGGGALSAVTAFFGAFKKGDGEAVSVLERIRARLKGVRDEVKSTSGGDNFFNGLNSIAQSFSARTGPLLKSLFSFRGAIVAVLAALGPLAAILGAVSAAAIGLLGDLGNLSGVLFALPGIIGAAIGGFGALALVMKPLSNVFSAYSAAQKEATSSSKSAAKAALDLKEAILSEAQAHLAYDRAIQDVPRAQSKLNDAYKQASRDIQDYRLALQKLKFDQEGAQLGVETSEQELRRSLADPTANNLDRKVAYHNVQGALFDKRDQAVAGQRLKQDSSEAFKKGVEGSDEVIDAQRAVVDATNDVTASYLSWQKAILAVQEARLTDKAGGTQAAALQAEIDKLPPATRKVAVAILALLKGPYKEMRDRLSENIFGPISGDTAKFADILKELESFLTPASVAMGKLAEKALLLFTNPDWKKFFTEQGEESGYIIQQLGDALLSAANGFKSVVEVARPFTRFVVDGILGMAKSFEAFSTSKDGRDKIAKFLANTRKTMTELKPVIKNFADGFLGFLSALNNTDGPNKGSSFLDRINKGLLGMSQTFNDLGDKARDPNGGFQKWLRNVGPLIKDVVHFLGDAGRFFGKLFSNTSNIKEAQSILAAIGGLLPILADIFDRLSKSGAISKLVDGISHLAHAFTEFLDGGGTTALSVFFSIVEKIGSFIDTVVTKVPALTTVLGTLTTALAFLAGAALFGRLTGIFALIGGVAKTLGFLRGTGGLVGTLDKVKDLALGKGNGVSAAQRTGRNTGNAVQLSGTGGVVPTLYRMEGHLEFISKILTRWAAGGFGGSGGTGGKGGTRGGPTGGPTSGPTSPSGRRRAVANARNNRTLNQGGLSPFARNSQLAQQTIQQQNNADAAAATAANAPRRRVVPGTGAGPAAATSASAISPTLTPTPSPAYQRQMRNSPEGIAARQQVVAQARAQRQMAAQVVADEQAAYAADPAISRAQARRQRRGQRNLNNRGLIPPTLADVGTPSSDPYITPEQQRRGSRRYTVSTGGESLGNLGDLGTPAAEPASSRRRRTTSFSQRVGRPTPRGFFGRLGGRIAGLFPDTGNGGSEPGFLSRVFGSRGGDEGSIGAVGEDPRLNVPEGVASRRMVADESRAYAEDARRSAPARKGLFSRVGSFFSRGAARASAAYDDFNPRISRRNYDDGGYATLPDTGRFLGVPLPGEANRQARAGDSEPGTTPRRRGSTSVRPPSVGRRSTRPGGSTRPGRGRGRGLRGTTPISSALGGAGEYAEGYEAGYEDALGGGGGQGLGQSGRDDDRPGRRRGEAGEEDEGRGRRRGVAGEEETSTRGRRGRLGRLLRGGEEAVEGGSRRGGIFGRLLGGAERAEGRGGGRLLGRLGGGLGRAGGGLARGLAGGLAGAALAGVASIGGQYLTDKFVKNDKDAASINRGLGAVSTGAGIGATIGSIIPGVGTVIGGAVGGLAGGAYSLFKDKNLRNFVGGKISSGAKAVGGFLGDTAGKVKDFFTPDKDTGTAGKVAATVLGPLGSLISKTDIGKSILESLNKAGSGIGNFFTKTIPNFFVRGVAVIGTFFTKTLPRLPGLFFDAFFRGVGRIAAFFIKDLPRAASIAWHGITGFFTSTLPRVAERAWHSITGFFTRTLPRAAAAVFGTIQRFILAIPGFFTETIPRWFSSVRSWINQQIRQPLVNFITKTIPQFFTETIPRWFQEAPRWFKTHVIDNVTNFFTVTVPGFFTTTLPDAIKALPGFLYDNLVQPILDFFKGIAGHIGDFLKGGWSWAKGLFSRAGKDVSEGYDSKKMSGGLIEGIFQGAEDTVRLRATPEEFVVRRSKVVQPFGKQFLNDYNEGRFNPADWYAGLSAATAPQTMSVVPSSAPAFATAGGGVVNHVSNSGLHMGDVTINNPVREKSEHSLRRQIQVAAIRHRL